jgi:NAD(P)-dependent dehydrogenase (short-subunit alcohol dehydrogenase family)
MTQAGEGKAVLVTGAARGVGQAIATRLLREGYRVALCDVTPGAPSPPGSMWMSGMKPR